MPLLIHAMLRALRVHRVAVHHARLANCEVGNVDHLLYLAITFGFDLAHFERNETAKGILVVAQRVADQSYSVAADRSRDRPPGLKRFLGLCYECVVFGVGRRTHAGNNVTGRGIHRLDQAR